jgi:sugar phosphate isomerase/epimerase
MNTVYASTACLRGTEPLVERVRRYHGEGIDAVELGAHVVPDVPFCVEDLPDYGSFLIHNYFPPPSNPFILNLASADPEVRTRSMDLVKEALQLSKALGSPVYSVHAGFVSDPTLAFAFEGKPGRHDAADALRRFVSALHELLPIAQKNGVRLLVENNVCTKANRGHLLCQTTEEFLELFTLLPADALGILLDTGHLNVSGHTFQFSPEKFVAALEHCIGAVHVHANDGSADQHQPVEEGSWVLDVLRRGPIARVPWIVEATFLDVQALADHLRFLRRISAESRSDVIL